jgi:hypothetical protein
MTAQSDPYVRVYYRIMDDPKFADVYDDSATLGTWLKLLIHADAIYPTAATLPQGVKLALVERLVSAGLVDLLPSHRYRMHGLAAEREQRSEHGRKAALVRHGQSTSNARATDEQSASSARPMHSEPLRAEPIQSAPLRTSPTPAGAEKHGSKNETDEERLQRYLAIKDDPSRSMDMRRAAMDEVERIVARIEQRPN